MYLFYLDESGSRDPSIGTTEKPKDHIYVLLAVSIDERQWRPFEMEVSQLKLTLAYDLRRRGFGDFDLADCEVKSNWLRRPDERAKRSRFLNYLGPLVLENLTNVYLNQVPKRSAVIMASVIDKRHLYSDTTFEALHQKAYELLLERIQNYMSTYNNTQQALVVMDDMDKDLNRAVAMRHASYLRSGNWNTAFQNIVEYPFFTRSELSNGVQLADQLAYNVYRALRYEDMTYSYFEKLLPSFYQSRDGTILHGLKVWPDASPLIEMARMAWDAANKKPSELEGV